MDKLHVDKLHMDKLHMDKLHVDKLHRDKCFTCIAILKGQYAKWLLLILAVHCVYN